MTWSSTEIVCTSSRSIATSVCLGTAFEDHGLGLEEGQQTFLATLTTDTRLLEPAERRAEVGAERVVADGSRPELTRHCPSTVDVVREHRRVEPVDGVVRDTHRILLVVRLHHREDRSEDLL